MSKRVASQQVAKLVMDVRDWYRDPWEQQQAGNNRHRRRAEDDGALSPRQSRACVFNSAEPGIGKSLCEPRQENQDCQDSEWEAFHESLFFSDPCGRMRCRLRK